MAGHGTLRQTATWPGVALVETCEYVCGHGLTPGRAILTTYPQIAKPKEFGSLTFSDGVRTFTLNDCRVVSVDAQAGPGGQTYTIEIEDRRWRWMCGGGVSGNYNQKDENGKLVPWSIRSPQELAAICLKEMGERNALVILPPGLPRAAGANLDAYLRPGQNFPQTLSNPETVWDHTNPAQALARLAEQWGCRVIYQPVRDRVVVCPLGKGKAFPNLPSEVIAANISQQAAPKYVACFSTDPVRFQMRWFLQAVGRDWHGAYLPIDELSYAPIDLKAVQKSQIVRWFSSAGLGLLVDLEWRDANGDNHARSVYVSQGEGGGTDSGKLDAVANKMLQFPDVAAAFVVTRPDANTVRFVSRVVNQPFTLKAVDPEGAATWVGVVMLQKGGNGIKGTWNNCPPPFENVQPTDRLSFSEAQGMAQDSVLRCYRVLNKDLHAKDIGPKGRPITLPLVGKIKRRQQFVLTDMKVDQVAPAPRIPGAANKGNVGAVNVPGGIPGGGVLPEFYNGYSRGQAATVTGSVWRNLGGLTVNYWLDPNNRGENTPKTERVFVDFAIDAKEQMIKFSSPVFKYAPGAGGYAYLEVPELILETSCFILDAETNQFVKWEQFLRVLNGTGPTEWFPREDMKVGVALRYDDEGRIIKTEWDGVQDAQQRAGYYLRGQATKYQIKGGEVRVYIGIVPHDVDAYCQQMSVSIGPGGPTTKLGGNTEFHPSIATYPARRRPENLPPDKSAALANLAERKWYDDHKAQ